MSCTRSGRRVGDIADLEPLHLGPMPDGEARELAQRLLIGIGQMPADPVVSEFISVGGGVPSILQKVASILRQRKRGVLNPQDVRECFEDIIDDRDEFLFSSTWESGSIRIMAPVPAWPGRCSAQPSP